MKRERLLSKNYDPTKKYVPRSQRPEWNVVGFLGQVHVRNDCVINPNWIKIKSVSKDIDLYLVK